MLAVVFLVSACDPSPSPSPSAGTSPRATSQPSAQSTLAPPIARPGQTIHVLTQTEQWNHVDPQRIYTPEDLAFFGATTMRALTAFKVSADPIEGTTLVPDMATDIGTATDGGRVWSFTLRPGVTWQDGGEVTCEDVKYGVSRSFATDVINQGPTYGYAWLDIPTDADESSAYKGPYSGKGQALFDKAVTCDGRTIKFRLNRPVVDFNATVTLGFGAVRQSDDTGDEYYGTAPPYIQSNGPYMVESYTIGNGGMYTLVRNPSWNPASDSIRKAYPDRWVVHFNLDPKDIDRRIMASEGDDASAILYGNVQQENFAAIFTDAGTAAPAFAGRAINGSDPYVRYHWINVEALQNVKVRQALMVALDRAALRQVFGGELFGAYADGVLKPGIGRDYAPTGIWDTFFGQVVPPTGDPLLARRLILESGELAPKVTFRAADTPPNQLAARVVVDSLARAGIAVTFDPISPGCGYGFCDPRQLWESADFATGGWTADWPNASTVIPALFTKEGGWDLGQVDDPAFNDAVDDALTTLDRGDQARAWQALNRTAVEQAWVIPTFLGLSQTIGGTKVAPLYRWPAYSSWPYAEMFVIP
jgi:peptide/nickel transport system substrate-binding protein